MPRVDELGLCGGRSAGLEFCVGLVQAAGSKAAGGLLPFDLRWSGYDLTAARAFLAALTAEGRAVYLGPGADHDTLFPVLFTLTLCLPLARPGLGHGSCRRWPMGS